MNLTIRKATADDAAAVWSIRSEAIRHACKGFYADDLLELWTAGDMPDGIVAGTGSINLEDGKLDGIFVRPDMMGSGIGKRIVAFCEELGHRAGLTSLRLEATLNAAPFYRRCGFVGDVIAVYRSPRSIPLDCFPMTKRIGETSSTL